MINNRALCEQSEKMKIFFARNIIYDVEFKCVPHNTYLYMHVNNIVATYRFGFVRKSALQFSPFVNKLSRYFG